MRPKRLVTTAFVSHRVYQVQDRANGKKKDEAADKDGKHDKQNDGPMKASLGESVGFLLPACWLIHAVELVVAGSTCDLHVSGCCYDVKRVVGKNSHE